MKYFIKNNEEVVGLLPELYAGIKLADGQSLHEISEADEARLLPEAYYNAKPAYIADVREYNFDFVPGTYNKFSDYIAECAWVGENAFVNISFVISAHYLASMPGDNLNDLDHTDVANISINDMPQAISESLNADMPVTINNKAYTAHFASGVASIAIDMPEYNTLNLQIDGKNKLIPVSFPSSITNMRNLRSERNIKLQACDNVFIRHMSQSQTANVVPSLSDTQFAELLAYMQVLRDLPATADLSYIIWPTKPEFV